LMRSGGRLGPAPGGGKVARGAAFARRVEEAAHQQPERFACARHREE
jgi:hypothetical protein